MKGSHRKVRTLLRPSSGCATAPMILVITALVYTNPVVICCFHISYLKIS